MSFAHYTRTVIAPAQTIQHNQVLIPNTMPMMIADVPHFPAIEFDVGRALKPASNDLCVQVMMQARSPIGNQLGMFAQMTPEGARVMAASLIEAAKKVEAHIAEQAAAAIEAARKNGPAASSGGTPQ